MRASHLALFAALALAGCSGGGSGGPGPNRPDPCAALTCAVHSSCFSSGARATCVCDPGMLRDGSGACVPTPFPAVGGCAVFAADHLFNTPIDALPVHGSSATWLAAIGNHPIHLDLGTQTNPAGAEYWGIPFNVVSGGIFTWPGVSYDSSPDESDCAAAGAQGTVIAGCDAVAAPVLPVPVSPLKEGGSDAHVLIVDADTCRLWELFAARAADAGWSVGSSASWNLASNALRQAAWTSADAAGFPILPLLLRQGEAASGTIRHALRFTLPNGRIRNTYVWPARHKIGSVNDANAVPMGQLFRLRADYPLPANTQSRAIVQAMKTYGMYLADAGSSWYVQGEPSAGWAPAIWDDVQRIRTSDLEAVDLSQFKSRGGWDVNSARVPPPGP